LGISNGVAILPIDIPDIFPFKLDDNEHRLMSEEDLNKRYRESRNADQANFNQLVDDGYVDSDEPTEEELEADAERERERIADEHDAMIQMEEARGEVWNVNDTTPNNTTQRIVNQS
jgi:hypothetical protein